MKCTIHNAEMESLPGNKFICLLCLSDEELQLSIVRVCVEIGKRIERRNSFKALWYRLCETLPDENHKVLVFDEKCGYSVCLFLGKKGKAYVFQSVDDKSLWFHFVSHWMDLPESPELKNDQEI